MVNLYEFTQIENTAVVVFLIKTVYMKRIMMLVIMLSVLFSAIAQKSASTKPVLPPAISNVQQTANSIAGELTGRLGLNPSKMPQLIPLLQRYLQQKSLINSLVTTNKEEYQAKFKSLQTALFDQLRGVLGPDKFALFQKLQSSARNTNAAHLFY